MKKKIVVLGCTGSIGKSTLKIIEEFSDRLMFATDICNPANVIKLGPWLDESCEKGCISFENYKKLCRDNAVSIFKL